MTDLEKNSSETNHESKQQKQSIFGQDREGVQGENQKSRFKISDRRFWARNKGKEAEGTEETETFDDTEFSLKRPAYIEELENKLAENEQQLRKYINAYKDHQKETSAFRERMNKSLEQKVEQQMSDFFRNLLEILDNFERSLFFADQNNDFDSLLTGVKMIQKQLLAHLEAYGVEVQERLGLEFDPNFDEVIAMVEPEESSQKPNTILEELQKCYLYKGNLLRPSKVRVIKP